MQQRKAILCALCARMPVCPSVDMAELALRTTGYVGADLSAMCREAAMHAIRENSKVNINYENTNTIFHLFLGDISASFSPKKYSCIGLQFI